MRIVAAWAGQQKIFFNFIVALLRNYDTLTRMNEKSYEARANILKALASPVRLRIVEELSRGECCLCELQPLFTMNKSTLSRHVAALRNVGIISERRDGVRVFLKLETPCILNVFDCAMGVIRSHAQRQVAMVG